MSEEESPKAKGFNSEDVSPVNVDVKKQAKRNPSPKTSVPRRIRTQPGPQGVTR